MMKGGGKANAVNCSNGQLLKLVTDHSGRGGQGLEITNFYLPCVNIIKFVKCLLGYQMSE